MVKKKKTTDLMIKASFKENLISSKINKPIWAQTIVKIV